MCDPQEHTHQKEEQTMNIPELTPTRPSPRDYPEGTTLLIQMGDGSYRLEKRRTRKLIAFEGTAPVWGELFSFEHKAVAYCVLPRTTFKPLEDE